MTRGLWILLCLLLSAEMRQAEQSTTEEREAIVNELLSRGHSPLVRPDGAGGRGTPVIVNVSYTLYRVLDADEASGQVSTSGVMWMTWTDPRLTFRGQNVTSVRLDTSLVWTPDIESYYTVDAARLMRKLNAKDLVVVRSSGQLTWAPRVTLDGLCEPSRGYFYPFMNCSVRFGSWTYDGHHVDVRWPEGAREPYTHDYVPTGPWRVTAVTVLHRDRFYPCCQDPYPTIDYTFRLARS